jgi:hypothetical protein
MAISKKVVSFGITSIICLFFAFVYSGCDLFSKKEDPMKKIMPLLLLGDTGPKVPVAPDCPDYSSDIDFDGNLVTYPGLYRLIADRTGRLTVDFICEDTTLTLYTSSCSVVPSQGTNTWDIIPGTYYIKLTSSMKREYSSFNLSLTRASTCVDGYYGIRFTNNALRDVSYQFNLYTAASCGGSSLYIQTVNHGSTGGWRCITHNTMSPGAYPSSSPFTYICGDTTTAFETNYDYTIELKSDDSWERTITYH